MMDEHHEELAALNALGMLEGSEQRALSGATARDKELRALTAELEETVAELAFAVQPVQPPAHLKGRIREKVRSRAGGSKMSSGSSGGFQVLGWGIAALLTVASTWLWNERTQLSRQLDAMTNVETSIRDERDGFEKKAADLNKQLAELGQEIATLRQRNAFAQVQISTLQSSVEAYKQGVAVVVWDSEKHEGILKLEKMPPVQAGKDYQLWVVDPKNPAPVDAGIVKVDAKGFAKIDFKPVDVISEASKFALSVEKEGGVQKGEGPIVLIGP